MQENKYLTVDFELADFLLPSICSMTIAYWENGELLNVEHQLINPDCELDPFLKTKHGFSEEDFADAPYFHEIWPQLFSKLNGKKIYFHHANRSAQVLLWRAKIDHMPCPDFDFFSTHSIANRNKEFFGKVLDVETIRQQFKMKKTIVSDAIVCGKIVQKAMEINNCNESELFQKIGMAGGYIRNNSKILYRANKRNEIYFKRIGNEFF